MHEKEKAKGKPQDSGPVITQAVTVLRRAVIVALLIVLGVPFACLMSYIIWIVIAYHVAISPFDPEEIAQTCRALSLPPDSTFCRVDGNQNTEELKTIIEQTYPVGSTTRTELEERFTTTFYNCDDRDFCSAKLPIPSVYLGVQLNKRGDVLGYRIEDERDSWLWVW